MVALYQDSGFQDVKVTVNTIDDYQGKKGDVVVTLAIEEGPQYKVAALNVEGITRSDRAQIAASLASNAGQPFSNNNVALDRDYILNLYQSRGYPDAAFDWRMTPGPGSNEVTVTYKISEGAPRFVRDVLLTGLRTTRRRLVNLNVLLKQAIRFRGPTWARCSGSSTTLASSMKSMSPYRIRTAISRTNTFCFTSPKATAIMRPSVWAPKWRDSAAARPA